MLIRHKEEARMMIHKSSNYRNEEQVISRYENQVYRQTQNIATVRCVVLSYAPRLPLERVNRAP